MVEAERKRDGVALLLAPVNRLSKAWTTYARIRSPQMTRKSAVVYSTENSYHCVLSVGLAMFLVNLYPESVYRCASWSWLALLII